MTRRGNVNPVNEDHGNRTYRIRCHSVQGMRGLVVVVVIVVAVVAAVPFYFERLIVPWECWTPFRPFDDLMDWLRGRVDLMIVGYCFRYRNWIVYVRLCFLMTRGREDFPP